jgi:ParB-like chromosome segregation protein Spo0J
MVISKVRPIAERIAASQTYQLLPPLSPEEFASLKADISAHGVLVPIELDTDGATLDGHHRLRAWTELKAEGVRLPDYPRIVRAGLSEDDKVAHVLALNLARRHLTPKQRAEVVGMLRLKGWSLRRIGEVAGVSDATVRRDLAAIATFDAIDQPERIERRNGGTYPARRASISVTSRRDEGRALAALATLGNDAPGRPLTVRRAEVLARQVELERRRNGHGKKVTQGLGWEIRHGDFRRVLADLDDHSLDLVVADPPYGDEALDLWSDLGEFAAMALKPGRVLVALTGKLRLPQVIRALTEHLEWVWMGEIIYSGERRMRKLRIDGCFRPLLVLSAGPYEPRSYFRDLIDCSERIDEVKRDHAWAAPLSAMVQIVEAFSKPGELVVDPMVGSGTTGVAALQLGRRFLGVDMDEAAVSLAVERLSGDLRR